MTESQTAPGGSYASDPADSMTEQGETVETRIGNLTFTHDFADGYPTADTLQKLYAERDFQRACQAYIWVIPMVAIG